MQKFIVMNDVHVERLIYDLMYFKDMKSVEHLQLSTNSYEFVYCDTFKNLLGDNIYKNLYLEQIMELVLKKLLKEHNIELIALHDHPRQGTTACLESQTYFLHLLKKDEDKFHQLMELLDVITQLSANIPHEPIKYSVQEYETLAYSLLIAHINQILEKYGIAHGTQLSLTREKFLDDVFLNLTISFSQAKKFDELRQACMELVSAKSIASLETIRNMSDGSYYSLQLDSTCLEPLIRKLLGVSKASRIICCETLFLGSVAKEDDEIFGVLPKDACSVGFVMSQRIEPFNPYANRKVCDFMR